MGRSHKVWINAKGGSSKAFGIGQDSSITLPVLIGSSATHSKLLSTIKISVDDSGDEIYFSISLDGQTYRTEKFDKKSKEFSGTEGKVVNGSIEHAEKLEKENSNSFLNTVGLIAKMGEIFTDSKKEANDWKKRMINAGLGNKGLTMPEDWDELTEEEKESRLNNAIDAIRE